MRAAIQQLLDELAAATDSRLAVFHVEIKQVEEAKVWLSGQLLSDRQLDSMRGVFADRLPTLTVDTASVQTLNQLNPPCTHVATNLTGLYEKPSFGVPLASELYYGTALDVLYEEGRWAFVRQPDGYLGWAYRPYLAEGAPVPATHLILAPSVELRAEADVHSPVRTRLVSGTGVKLLELRAPWGLVSANETGWLPSEDLRPIDKMPTTAQDRRQALAVDAARMIGTPYLWGGMSGNGIDCSGLAHLLHHWIGLEIPRDADMQCNAANPVKAPFEVGDLFFFGENDAERKVTHVGISLGGSRLVHSSRSHNGVYVDDLDQSASLREIYLCAGSFLR